MTDREDSPDLRDLARSAAVFLTAVSASLVGSSSSLLEVPLESSSSESEDGKESAWTRVLLIFDIELNVSLVGDRADFVLTSVELDFRMLKLVPNVGWKWLKNRINCAGCSHE